MKRHEKDGNFIIPKMPKMNDDTIKIINATTPFSSSNGKTESQSKATSSSHRHHRHSSIWTGSLHFGEQVVESVDLHPLIRGCSKPLGFSSCLEMQQLTKSKDFVNYWPIQELIKEITRNNNEKSPLLKKRSIIICSSSEQQKTTIPVRISYLYLINTFSPLFARICKEMVEKELVAFGLLSNSSLLFLFPSGPLSTKLDIPARDGPLLHCLFISEFKELKSKFELYNFENIPLHPSSIDKFDGNDPKIISELNNYHKESNVPINAKLLQPKQLESIFTPNQRPPGGKPVTPYIPTPSTKYPQQSSVNRRFPSASPNFNSSNTRPSKQYFPPSQQQQQQQFHPYTQQQQHLPTTSTNSSNFLSMLLMPPPPPPPPPPPESEDISPTLERKQKNKAMIANAFEQIRSIGKEKTSLSEGGTSSKITQTSLEQQKQQSDNLIRDPRLSKRLTESQQPPPPPPTSSSKEIFEKKNGDMKIEQIVEEKVEEKANIKNEPTEILHETLPMDISYGGDALAMSLQMYFSSPEEPMEEDEQINT
ncbi:unnamed protein product [Meloidogyne enterolobii]